METCRKVFVEVTGRFTEDGKITPLSLKWEDGRVYDIDRVTDVRNRASMRAGGKGMRYECQIRNRSSFLYYEDGKWFVEAL